MHLLYAPHLPFLLLQILLLFLAGLVNPSDEPLNTSLVSEAIFMLLS